MAHDELLEAAKTAADELHRDISVSVRQTWEDLCDLREHVDSLVEAVACCLEPDDVDSAE